MSDSSTEASTAAGAAPGPGTVLGARLRCAVCGSQAVVTKAAEGAELRCHDQPLKVVSAPTVAPSA